MKTFVVNLDRHPDRLASIDSQLKALNIPFERIAAVDGVKLSQASLGKVYDPELCKSVLGRELARGEIGCAMSHLTICQRMQDEGISLACVLEDDAQLSQNLPKALRALQYLEETNRPTVCLLTHVGRYTDWGARTLDSERRVCKTVDAYCTHGYVLNRAAAQALLLHNRKITHPIDFWNDLSARGVLKVRAVVPYVVGHSAFASHSEIETERLALSQVDALPLIKKLVRSLRSRIYDKLVYELIKPFLRIRKQKQTF